MAHYGTVTSEVTKRFEEVLGSDKVSDNPAVAVTYRGGGQHGPLHYPFESDLPKLVCMPESVEDIVNIFRLANEYKLTVVPVRADISHLWSPQLYGVQEHPDIVVDLTYLDKILEINVDEGYAVIEGGVTFDKLQYELAKHGCWCTTGSYPPVASVVARYIHFPQNWGVYERRLILSAEVVTPTCRVIRTSAAPQVSWLPYAAAGSVDLLDLFLSSACPGIITKAAIIIYPSDEKQEVIWAGFPSFSRAWDYLVYCARRYLIDGGMIWHWKRMVDSEFYAGDMSKGFLKWYELQQIPAFEQPPPLYHYVYTWATACGPSEVVESKRAIIEKVVGKIGGVVISDDEFKETLPNMYEYWSHACASRFATYHYSLKQRVLTEDYFIVNGPKNIVIDFEREALRKAWEDFGINVGYYSGRPQGGGRVMCWIRWHIPTDRMDWEETKNNIRIHHELWKWIIEKYYPLISPPGNPFLLRVILNEAGINPPEWLCTKAKNLGTAAPKTYWEPHSVLRKEITKILDPNHICNPFGQMAHDYELAKLLVREGKVTVVKEVFE
ncbi:MAG: FAD-binding oxidoreductase [Candidatus Bathyarchaeia archaeon]